MASAREEGDGRRQGMLHNLCLYLFIAISDKMRLAHVLRMWLPTRGARCQTETACLPPGSLSGTSVSSNKLLTVHRKLNFKNKRQPYSHLSHLQDSGRREGGERTIGDTFTGLWQWRQDRELL